MSLDAKQQQEYDAAVEVFRDAARVVLRIGSDNLVATTEDLDGILSGVFEEFE